MKFVGGAKRDRTADLLLARQALSQLSYGPANSIKTEQMETRYCGSQASDLNVFIAEDDSP